jgi:hypothetical protein
MGPGDYSKGPGGIIVMDREGRVTDFNIKFPLTPVRFSKGLGCKKVKFKRGGLRRRPWELEK